MTQKKLPLINSAHGSDTRNIINELMRIFNNMGYTYNESLQKAQDILDEAQQTNDMNESVQQQIDTLIAESGTSDAEVVQARIDSEGNEYGVLKTRLDEKEQNFSAQLAQTAEQQTNYLQHFSEEPYFVEERDTTHTGGFKHTAFCGGCTFKNKELYVARNAPHHNTEAERGVIVGYIRNHDGTFDSKVVVPQMDEDPRDMNLSTTKDGNRLFLSVGCNVDDTSENANYITYLWELDENLNVIGNKKKLFDGFGWGNILVTPNGRLLKTRYHLGGSRTGVRLMRSINSFEAENLESEEVATIFPATNATECTLAYWGNKLVALTRANGKALYRETYNLEGDDGWGEIVELNYGVVAPALQPYNQSETLLATITTVSPRYQALIATDNGFDWSEPVIVNSHSSAYGTIVPNRYGLGVMSYAEYGNTVSNVHHVDVDVNKIIKVNELDNFSKWERREVNSRSILGDSTKFDYFDNAVAYKYIYFKVKESITFRTLYLFTKNNYDGAYISGLSPALERVNGDGTIDTLITVHPVDESQVPDMNSNPARVEYRGSIDINLETDELYRIKVNPWMGLGKKTLTAKNKTVINADLGELIYVKSKTAIFNDGSSGEKLFNNSIYPFEIGTDLA